MNLGIWGNKKAKIPKFDEKSPNDKPGQYWRHWLREKVAYDMFGFSLRSYGSLLP